MNKQCPDCGLINFSAAFVCHRCNTDLGQVAPETSARRVVSRRRRYFKRLLYTPVLIVVILLGFYISLRVTSEPLTTEQSATVARACALLQARGFASETVMLQRLTTLRATDNWFNRYLGHESAFAATNFPFQVLTLYPDFFDKTHDDTERAVVLLHEAQHLYGGGEDKAYEYVWRKRRQILWTKELYGATQVWHNVSEATHTYAPALFSCGLEQNLDCTE